MDVNSNREYILGPFRLSENGSTLRKGEEEIRLPRKRYDLLMVLVRNAGRLVTKEELLSEVWPEQDVEESNLTSHIHHLRRIIEQDASDPQLLITVSGKGYKLQAVVTTVGGAPPEEEVPPPSRDGGDYRRPVLVIASVAVVLLVAAIAVASFGYINRWRRVDARLPAEPTPVTSYDGLERDPAISADGRRVAFVREGDESSRTDLYVKDIDGGEPIRISFDEGREFQPVWSPDERYIAYLRESPRSVSPFSLMVVSASGGIEREVARVGGGLDWSPDGKYLAVLSQQKGVGIELVSADGSEWRKVTSLSGEQPLYDADPRFSPDGKTLAFVRWTSEVSGDIHLVDLKSGALRRLTTGLTRIHSPSLQWVGDGKQICFVTGQSGRRRIWRVGVDGGSPEVVPSLQAPIESYAIARNRNLMIFASYHEDSKIVIMPNPLPAGEGRTGQCQIDSTFNEVGPDISPDGSMVAFLSDRSGWDEIWLARSDCTGVRQLTGFNEKGVGAPRWAPDGRSVVFERRVGGHAVIYSMSIDGMISRRLTDSPVDNKMPWFSADGAWLYFAAPHGADALEDVWKMPAAGGTPVRVTTTGATLPMISPDSRTLYFFRSLALFRKDLLSGQETQINKATDSERVCSSLAPGGLYYQSGEQQSAILLNRLDLASSKRLTIPVPESGILNHCRGISVSADERLIAISGFARRQGDLMKIEGGR